jgi:ribonuclease HII
MLKTKSFKALLKKGGARMEKWEEKTMGYKKIICGLDEAGRGALAGPIVIAGVVLPSGFRFQRVFPNGVVKDSKELSGEQRKALFQIIKKYALQIIVEVISPEEITKKGINWANTEGFRRVITKVEADQYLIDGRWKLPDLGEKNSRTKCVIKGDKKIPAVLAAGIIAKVERDEIMQKLHLEYPQYHWNTNTGHGTQAHLEAIRKYGICKYHRKKFVHTALKEKLKRKR